MDHACRNACEAAERGRLVEIPGKRRHTRHAQGFESLGAGAERPQQHAAAHRARDAQTDIAAADDEHALAAKARRQRAKGTLD
jgi:hypothetical protein